MQESGELQNISRTWQKEFELHLVEDEQTSHEQTSQAISEFMQEHQQTFKEIETFMHILHDWIDETSHSIQSNGGGESSQSATQYEGGEKAKVINNISVKAQSPLEVKDPNYNSAPKEDKNVPVI